ncbi:ArsR family transcriptional regulator [Halobacteriales archaeon QS_4_62_28]|nr:MAG: ArsR family transcriptional regulator [Halobacteriales archaeon QS_4_62_28]
MTETRRRLRDHVHTHPGAHFNALTRALDLAPGQVQYHLKKLRDRDAVVEERLYGKTHYYPPGFDCWERHAIALLRRETARDVLVVLLDGGPARPATVAEAVGIARSTLFYQTERLIEQDLVEKRTDDGRVTLAVCRPTATAQLLDEIDPSIPERLLDRFTRLVDDLLETDNRE